MGWLRSASVPIFRMSSLENNFRSTDLTFNGVMPSIGNLEMYFSVFANFKSARRALT